MFSNLVVALDGSACATHALDLALSLSKAEGGRLAICAVAEPYPAAGSTVPHAVIDEALVEMKEQATRVVDAAVAKATDAGIAAIGRALEGEPVHEIVAYAHEVGADAIVIGTHGRSGLKRLFMGSVAEGVLRSAPVPVVTVREEARIARLLPDAVR